MMNFSQFVQGINDSQAVATRREYIATHKIEATTKAAASKNLAPEGVTIDCSRNSFGWFQPQRKYTFEGLSFICEKKYSHVTSGGYTVFCGLVEWKDERLPVKYWNSDNFKALREELGLPLPEKDDEGEATTKGAPIVTKRADFDSFIAWHLKKASKHIDALKDLLGSLGASSSAIEEIADVIPELAANKAEILLRQANERLERAVLAEWQKQLTAKRAAENKISAKAQSLLDAEAEKARQAKAEADAEKEKSAAMAAELAAMKAALAAAGIQI